MNTRELTFGRGPMPIGPDVFTNSPTGFEVATGAQIAAKTSVPSLDPKQKIKRIIGGALAAIAGLGLTTTYLNDTAQHAFASNPESRLPPQTGPDCELTREVFSPSTPLPLGGDEGFAVIASQRRNNQVQDMPNVVVYTKTDKRSIVSPFDGDISSVVIAKPTGKGKDCEDMFDSGEWQKAIGMSLRGIGMDTDKPYQLFFAEKKEGPDGKTEFDGKLLPVDPPSNPPPVESKPSVLTSRDKLQTPNNAQSTCDDGVQEVLFFGNSMVHPNQINLGIDGKSVPGDAVITTQDVFVDRLMKKNPGVNFNRVGVMTDTKGIPVASWNGANMETSIRLYRRYAAINGTPMPDLTIANFGRNDGSAQVVDKDRIRYYAGESLDVVANSNPNGTIFIFGALAFDPISTSSEHNMGYNLPNIVDPILREVVTARQERYKKEGKGFQIVYVPNTDHTETDYLPHWNDSTGKTETGVHWSEQAVRKMVDTATVLNPKAVCLNDKNPTSIFMPSVSLNVVGPPAEVIIPAPGAPITTTEPMTQTRGIVYDDTARGILKAKGFAKNTR